MTTITLNNIFDDLFVKAVQVPEPVINVRKLDFDPLSYIIDIREESSYENNRRYYNKLMYEVLDAELAGNGKLIDIDISAKAIEHAQEIRKHFRNKIMLVSLRGHHVSDFRTALQEILETDETKSSHLPILIRLPEYYQEDKFMEKLMDNYDSVEYPENGYAKFDDTVTFVDKYTRYGKRNNFTKYFFVDSKKQIVTFKHIEQNSMFDPFVNYFAQPGKSFGIRGTLPISTDTGYPFKFYQLVGKGSYEFY